MVITDNGKYYPGLDQLVRSGNNIPIDAICSSDPEYIRTHLKYRLEMAGQSMELVEHGQFIVAKVVMDNWEIHKTIFPMWAIGMVINE